MAEQEEQAIDIDGTYDHKVHAQVMSYAQNLKLRDLLDLTDDEIIHRHDALLTGQYGNSMMGADEYREEWYRRATLKSALASEEYNRRIDMLLILLAVAAVIPLVLDLWDRWHLGDSVTYLLCRTGGC